MTSIQLNDRAATEHFLAVKSLIIDRANSIIQNGYIGIKSAKYNTVRINADNLTVTMLNYVLSNLEKIIITKPSELPTLITSLLVQFPGIDDSNTSIFKIAYNLFIDHAYKSFNKLEFINKINMDTCLYCNRNYIYALDKKDKIKPQIDHFYPKAIYPFLGLSFYNLIPSCQTCNGFDAKVNKDPLNVGLRNPYLINNSDFKFTFKVRSIKFLNPLADPSSIKIEFIDKIQGHLDVFRLDKLYEKHTDHAIELYIKSKLKYTEKYRTYLRNYKGFKFSNNEINRMIIGNYTKIDELHKRPLAKLYYDIAKELKLI